MSDFVMDKALLRVELKSVSTTSGAQFVMTFGQMMMAMWSADSLDSLQLVLHITYIHTFATFMNLPLTESYIICRCSHSLLCLLWSGKWPYLA